LQRPQAVPELSAGAAEPQDAAALLAFLLVRSACRLAVVVTVLGMEHRQHPTEKVSAVAVAAVVVAVAAAGALASAVQLHCAAAEDSEPRERTSANDFLSC
jgi:hypothetical protein